MRTFAADVPHKPAERGASADASPEAEEPPQLASGTWVEGLTVEPRRQSAADAPVTTVMTREVACVSPRATAAEAAEMLLELGVNGAPVIDSRGRPIGVITRGDLLGELVRGGGATRVEDCMTCMAFAVSLHASVGQAAALMAYEGVHRVLVCDERGRLVGLVSALDIARFVGERSGKLAARSNLLED